MKDKKVLDIGSLIESELYKKFVRDNSSSEGYFGFDIDEESIRWLQEFNAFYDIYNTNESQVFDHIFLIDVYEHLYPDERIKILRVCNNLLFRKEVSVDSKASKATREWRDSRGPNIGIHPGGIGYFTYKVSKLWNIRHFAELVKLVLEKHPNSTIYLTGDSSDAPIYSRLVSEINNERVVSLVGNTSLDGLTAFISNLDLYITNDTGTFHIADAVGVNTICVTGPTAPYLVDETMNKNVMVLDGNCELGPCVTIDGFRKCSHTCGQVCLTTITAKEVMDCIRVHKLI